MSDNNLTEQDEHHEMLAVWRRKVERATYFATAFLRMALRKCEPSAIVELLQSVPKTPDEPMDKRESLFVRVAKNANRFHDRNRRELLMSAYDYFDELAKEDPRVRQLIEATIAGVFQGYNKGR